MKSSTTCETAMYAVREVAGVALELGSCALQRSRHKAHGAAAAHGVKGQEL